MKVGNILYLLHSYIPSLFDLGNEYEDNILKYLVSIPTSFEEKDPDLEANLVSESINAQHVGIDSDFKQVSNNLFNIQSRVRGPKERMLV